MKRNERKKPMKLDARRHLILEAIAQGMTYSKLVDKFTKEWHLGKTTVESAIFDALSFMRSETTKDTLISMNMERLDNIISDSLQDGDRKNALKAIDTQNKLAGGYEEKVKLETENEINLVFDIGQ